MIGIAFTCEEIFDISCVLSYLALATDSLCLIPKKVKLFPGKFSYSLFRLLVLKIVQHHLSY